MEKNKIINGNCWIAYFDVLGFSNLVKDFQEHPDFIKETFHKALAEGGQFNSLCKFKYFSDSFIFYTENDSLDSFVKIRDVTMYFYSIMFADYQTSLRFPLRGCLNIGKLYSDENNGIFFGQALIDAYHLAEGQNWIGYVLSENVLNRLKELEPEDYKKQYKSCFKEYNVPYKKEPKNRKYYTYKINFLFKGSQDYSLPNKLCDRLHMMWFEKCTPLSKNKCSECRKILTKYINTENYLRDIYPILEKEKKMFDQDELCSQCRKGKNKLKSL